MKIVTAVALFLLGATGLPLHAADGRPAAEAKAPVAIARTGFTPSQARKFRERYSYEQVISAGDVSLFHFLNLGIWLPTAMVSRQGGVVDLATAIDPKVGQTRVANATGGVDLSAYLRSTASRAQGMVVVHKGRFVFEDYPGMRPSDFHVWMSVAKTTASLVVRLLAEEGKVDVEKPIDSYMPALRNTEWAGVIENQAGRENPRSAITRYNLAASGEKNADGEKESLFELIRSAKRSGPAGKAFEYSSINTTLLALLAETVENKRWSDICQQRVWSKMTVEGDLQVWIAPDSTPLPHGLVASRLRDMARYGMLYTLSWHKAARERIVSQAYVRQIQEGGRKEIFLRGDIGNHLTTAFFPASPPSANHWQSDAVWRDGDFYKGGVYGQGLYVSPAKDLVIVWFSTAMSNDLTQYARRIAVNTLAVR